MRYVVGFLCDTSGHVLLVRKLRPAWQNGRLNGIGGKIEPGETPLAAMIREWVEEVGFAVDAWRPFCVLTGGDYEVHFFAASLPILHEDMLVRHANDVGEAFEVIALVAGLRERSDLIPNLKWLAPMAFDDPSLPSAAVNDQGIVEASHVEGLRAASGVAV